MRASLPVRTIRSLVALFFLGVLLMLPTRVLNAQEVPATDAGTALLEASSASYAPSLYLDHVAEITRQRDASITLTVEDSLYLNHIAEITRQRDASISLTVDSSLYLDHVAEITRQRDASITLAGGTASQTSFTSGQGAEVSQVFLDDISRVLADLSESRDFSGSVLVGRGDDVIFSAGYGYAVREWKVPNTAESVFLVSPIINQVISAAVLNLQQTGELALDDPICNYLARCPATWQGIRIIHLLTHTSGITNGHDSTAASPDLPLAFAPGEEFLHASYGDELLEEIVAFVSGVPFDNYLRGAFYGPLGLDQTYLGNPVRIFPYRAEGYETPYRRAGAIDMAAPLARPTFLSNADNLFRWSRALHNGEIISQSTMDAMWQHAFDLGDGSSYVGGYLRFDNSGQELIRSAGGDAGFQAEVMYAPAGDMTVIVLSNLANNTANAAAMAIMELVRVESDPL